MNLRSNLCDFLGRYIEAQNKGNRSSYTINHVSNVHVFWL